MRRKDVEGILPDLESEDAFSRLEGEQRLRGLLLRDFGFRWDADPVNRTAALLRLRKWLEEAERREKTRRTALSGLAAVGLQALQGLAPEEVEKHLQEFLAKAKAGAAEGKGRRACEACGKRPATVEVVEVRDLRATALHRSCEPCATARGDFRA